MIKVEKIDPYGNGHEGNLAARLNEFFAREKLGKDNIVNISMVTRRDSGYADSGYAAFYVFYDDGQK